jgi:hypothetical protein
MGDCFRLPGLVSVLTVAAGPNVSTSLRTAARGGALRRMKTLTKVEWVLLVSVASSNDGTIYKRDLVQYCTCSGWRRQSGPFIPDTFGWLIHPKPWLDNEVSRNRTSILS